MEYENKAMQLDNAINEGNLAKVKELLQEKPELISKKALFKAALSGNICVLKYIVEYSRISLNEYDDEHRNVLFYGAKSGSLEVFEYLVERCGMDPLSADKNLLTPWDIVHDKYLEIEAFLEKRYDHKYEDFYRNPVRTGFFPDPSICRVGSDYYMVNSSFVFFPCIPISHSKDLVHWEIIGHAITDPKWAKLEGLEGGRGYWAPDISFYEGRFYITATYRLNDVPPVYRRQIVVSSDKPQGPYTEPVFIDEDGIDPSIFNDEDGRRYMLLNRGARIFELDKSATRKISDAELLFYGDNKRAPEGPHLFKKDGYYYLLMAEGGTGDGHMVTVSRSKTLKGVYEPCPYNPIMRQSDEGALIQRCGHGDMVETEDGRWFMVYLCGRKVDDKYSLLGRETAIDPVTWTSDGWPIVNNLKGPSCMQVKLFCDKKAAPDIFNSFNERDEESFDFFELPFEYMVPRALYDGEVRYEVKDGVSSFVIKAGKAPLSDVACRSIVLRRQTDYRFKYSVVLSIQNLADGQDAGITGYYDENTFFAFGVIKRADGLHLYSLEHIGDENRRLESEDIIDLSAKEITLSMNTDYLERVLEFTVFGEEKTFTKLSNVYYLCDEGLKKGKRFTGALVGMYCVSKDSDGAYASFKNPEYRVVD